ncbi:helix-turn-helix domain-containing protein [Enterococcus faecalis]|uniref:helix-turn-helix domain-containing protein n=1 Tax=Enterococcus faecalis TaxID=1351 RepID=UPI000D5084EF|nr:helix-turn-helix transcriptional regulator [Enterococcus faecalis]MCD5164721.1 helix-turn-helix transcriptional regulator [Enterococcus faecalis]PVE29603.1 XRE family transcriptional regulator [Enterococcus faecalis]RXF55355.1 XRE family transcriptional regulator [Enterococcus faecalis]WAL89285.1 helix-turn-helix transcriptional regulator [Enterococcus faecalis]WPH43449.1 helix-turn-helix transcriptional regulator [Enterococcus faecalis]
MNTYEIIKELTKRKKMSIRQLEITLGYSNGYFSKWKKVSPNSEGLQKVADYFNVSVDYLLGRTDNTKATDEKNSDDLNDVLDNVMSFDGEPLDDHDREVIRAYLKGRFGK